MTIGAGISVADGKLVVLGNTVLDDVHDNIVVTPATGGALANGAFIGVTSDQMGCRRVFPVGKLQYVHLFLLSLSYFCSLFTLSERIYDFSSYEVSIFFMLLRKVWIFF